MYDLFIPSNDFLNHTYTDLDVISVCDLKGKVGLINSVAIPL
jgi:hypothetical protein